jgi:hypothetical protein
MGEPAWAFAWSKAERYLSKYLSEGQLSPGLRFEQILTTTPLP